MLHTVVAAGILAISLVLLVLKPRRVPDWATALGAGLLTVVLGLLPPAEAGRELVNSWNIFLFFLGLGLAAATADRAGVFHLAADLATRWSGGSQWRLLVGVYGIGVLVTAVLSVDATALLLTPVIFAIATRAGVDPRPYAFACALVANAASFVLPVSNPANLLLLAQTPLSLAEFLGHLLLPSLLAVLATLVGLLLVFRDYLTTPFVPETVPVEKQRRAVMVGLGVGVLAAVYVFAASQSWPLGPVALGGAISLVALDAAYGGWAPSALVKEVPWGLLPLYAGLLLLLGSAERGGVFDPLRRVVGLSASLGVLGPPVLVASLAALANVVNNLPAALASAATLGGLAPGPVRTNLVAAAIVGVDLGPNLSTVGSLATMVWVVLMRRRGMEVSALSYLRVGITITVPALVAATLGLALTAR